MVKCQGIVQEWFAKDYRCYGTTELANIVEMPYLCCNTCTRRRFKASAKASTLEFRRTAAFAAELTPPLCMASPPSKGGKCTPVPLAP